MLQQVYFLLKKHIPLQLFPRCFPEDQMRQHHWRCPFPSPGDLPGPGIEPECPALQADSLPSAHQESPEDAQEKAQNSQMLFNIGEVFSFCFSRRYIKEKNKCNLTLQQFSIQSQTQRDILICYNLHCPGCRKVTFPFNMALNKNFKHFKQEKHHFY